MVLVFEVPISNNKENTNIATSPWDALGKKYLFEFLDKYENSNIYV